MSFQHILGSKVNINAMCPISYLLLTLCTVHMMHAADMDETKLLMDDLFRNYSTDLRPIKNQSRAVPVNIDLSLISINDFDEVAGVISTVAILYISWKDESLVWNPNQYGNTTSLTFTQRKIWLPKMFLTNPATTFKPISNKHFRVTVTSDGTVLWVPGDILRAACTPDVSKFPFDEQTCVISITAWGYRNVEVSLTTSSSTLLFSYYSENSEWLVTGSSASLFTDPDNDVIDFSLTFRRKPQNFLVTVVIPIIMLSCVNPLGFILPFDSGERVSYSITVLLAFSVYMTVVSDRMPTSSEPMSNISYYLLSLLAMSVLIVTINILQIRIYSKNDEKEPVPAWLSRTVRRLQKVHVGRNRRLQNKEESHNEEKPNDQKNTPLQLGSVTEIDKIFNVNSSVHENEKMDYTDVQDIGQQLEPVKWYTVAKMLDKLYFGIFICTTIFSSIIYFIRTTT